MFQNLLSSSPWVWSGLAIGLAVLPVLIHMINHFRFRTVRWAAMDFLLASHRRNRNRVWLKQLLLLLSRIGVLLLVLASVSRIGCNSNRWAGWFAASPTHHYVLVDDSYSMSESVGGVAPIDRAHQVLQHLSGQISRLDQQRLTVIRWSRAAQWAETTEGDDDSPAADLNGVEVDREINARVDSLLARIQPASMAVAPRDALELAGQLIRRRDGEKSTVYVLSDFRNRDWAAAPDVANAIVRLRDAGAEVELVRCAEQTAANLVIKEMKPAGSIRVAGVPLMMELSVQNVSGEAVRNVQIKASSAAFPDPEGAAASPDLANGTWTGLPVLFIESIEPGESVTREFPVFFSQPGQHVVHARLPDDAIVSDNQVWSVIRLGKSARVLIVDDPPGDDARFVALGLNPGGMTGIESVPGTRAMLRDASIGELAQYESIFLLDVDRLDESAVTGLRAYVEQGGGLVYFTGPRVNLEQYTTQLYTKGDGIFPLPLSRVAEVTLSTDAGVADIVPQRHPVFSHVIDVTNSLLGLVQVKQVLQPPLEWTAGTGGARVLATVRGEARTPLVVEKSLGRGTILAVLTTAGPEWSNWCRNGTFPATILLMQEYVSRGRASDTRHITGAPIFLDSGERTFQGEYEIVTPGADLKDRVVWRKTADPVKAIATGRDREGVSASETIRPGIYEVWRRELAGPLKIDRMAVNVDVSESETELIDNRSLAATAGSGTRITSSREFRPALERGPDGSLARILLVVLLVLILCEQFLGLINSYHPARLSTGGTQRA